jgi:hypothetical protein
VHTRNQLLQARDEAMQKIRTGTMNDPVFENALKLAGEGRKVEEFGGDYFETILPKRKSDMASGRVFLNPVERSHGLSTSAATYQAMAAAENMARTGKSKIVEGAGAKDLNQIAAFLQKHVMPTSISSVGTKGSRGNATDEQILLRAAALYGDTYNGFDPKSGMPFNMMKGQTGVVGRDAGHFIGHASRPDLSNDPYNIGYQNQYENKGQSAAEKIASQQGRVATGTEIADMLWKSIVNRTVEDVKLPRKNSAEFKALMGPINAKVNQSRMAGQIFIV